MPGLPGFSMLSLKGAHVLMAKFLYQVGRGAYANRWKVLALWLLILIGVGVAAATLQNQRAPHSQSLALSRWKLKRNSRPGSTAKGKISSRPNGQTGDSGSRR